MRVLVCGGRDDDDSAFIVNVLDRVHARQPVTLLIEGGATEVDNLARRWAIARGIEVATYRANRDRYQHRAVPIRNAQMLREGRPGSCSRSRVVAGPRTWSRLLRQRSCRC